MASSPVTNDRAGSPPAGRKQLLLVLALFLGPILAAILLYATADRWMTEGPTGQHGDLFRPPVSLEAFALTGVDGAALSLADLRGQWTVVVLGAGECGDDCRQALYKVRQAHKAQGKNIGRLQRVFVALEGAPGEKTRAFLEAEHPHLRVATPAGEGAGLAAFRQGPGQGLEGIYVVDPHANLVLRYGLDAGAKGILKDLDQLLKHSTIG